MLKVNRKKLPLAVLQALSAGAIVGVVAPVANAQVSHAQTTPTDDQCRRSPEIFNNRNRLAHSVAEHHQHQPRDAASRRRTSSSKVSTNVENLLNNLPQVFADFGANDIQRRDRYRHGQPAQPRRRPHPGADQRSPPAGRQPRLIYPTDLNQIPAPLIERVEILTGGASAVYGSDAVSGVVNFIMKDNFQGVQIEGQLQRLQPPAGAMASPTSSRRAPRPTRRSSRCRAMSAHDGEATTSTSRWAATSPTTRATPPCSSSTSKDPCATASRTRLQRVRDRRRSDGMAWSARGSSTASRAVSSIGRRRHDVHDRQRAGRRAAVQRSDWTSSTSRRTTTYQRPDERYGFNAFAHYDVNEHARVYGEFSFHDNHTDAQIAPSGIFGVQ